jgi:hypothetical protein
VSGRKSPAPNSLRTDVVQRISTFSSKAPAADGIRQSFAFWLVLSLHALACALMLATEAGPLGVAVFLCLWTALHCLWLAVLRWPIIAALVSLVFLGALTLLSRFKYDKLWMTIVSSMS